MSKNKVLKNISSLFLVQLANYLFPMVSLPIIVRIIGAENFGLINYASSIVLYCVLLINYSFSLTATKKIAQSPNDTQLLNRVFSEVMGAKLFLLLISLIGFTAAMVYIDEMREHWQVMWFSFMLCLGTVLMPDWVFQGRQKLDKLAYFNLVIKVLFTISVLLFVRNKDDYFYQPLVMSISQALIAVLAIYYLTRREGLKLRWPQWPNVFQMLKEDRVIFLSLLVTSLYVTTNTVVLGAVSSPAEVGYFSAAHRFIIIEYSLLTVPLSMSLYPFICSSFSSDENNGLKIVRRIFPLVVALTLICGFATWVAGPFFVELFYGREFLPSKAMFQVMCFIPFLMLINNLLGAQVMLNLGLQRQYLVISFAITGVSVMINFTMSSHYGGMGASYANLLTEICFTIILSAYLYIKRVSVIDLNMFRPYLLSREIKYLLSGNNFIKRRA